MTIWPKRVACWITWATNTLRIRNSFSTTTMVTRMRLNAMLNVHFLSCYAYLPSKFAQQNIKDAQGKRARGFVSRDAAYSKTSHCVADQVGRCTVVINLPLSGLRSNALRKYCGGGALTRISNVISVLHWACIWRKNNEISQACYTRWCVHATVS